ncbi:ABC transporter permease [Coriobacteriia bacterium Es71-Z0120]|uniref:ABC transporter permease n=1 Tax=Parvivirga hydrogeniphila TaxID=2939460 RepID=UPI002260C275|nr:ABC transporter permease [Parvivirga hydrogeniphila]MCL4079424.1 ABC transporter permease [Parvivirga hydrogeniphila]
MPSEQTRQRVVRWAGIAVLGAATAWMTLDARGFERLLKALAPHESSWLYPTKPLVTLMAEQVWLATAASLLAFVAGGLLGALALTRFGIAFRDLVLSAASLAQTVPTVALMALLVPLTGYGPEPVIVALTLYSVLPIALNVIAGIESVPPEVRDAATGIGMGRLQRLVRVELPLAMPVIMGGVKNVVVINVSAATLGAVVAAGGLGMPILAGFHDYNDAYILEGALPAIALALLLDRALTVRPRWDVR